MTNLDEPLWIILVSKQPHLDSPLAPFVARNEDKLPLDRLLRASVSLFLQELDVKTYRKPLHLGPYLKTTWVLKVSC
jgi:hypothetical protein